MEIGVLGAGSWGAALSILLSDNQHNTTTWSYIFNSSTPRKNFKYLNNIQIPNNVYLTSDIKKVLNKKIILIALPSHLIESILTNPPMRIFLFSEILVF